MKKILMVGLTIPEEGGSERHIYEISSRIPNCTVLTQKNSLCKNKIELPVMKSGSFMRNISFALMCYLYVLKLLFEKRRFDVIHIHENLLYFMAPLLNIRYETVITVHGLKGFKFYDKKYLWFFFSFGIRQANKIITHGYFETQEIKKINKNVKNIPDGVDIRLSKNIKSNRIEKKITFVGRIHEQKGIESLLRAFLIVSEKFFNYKLEIIAKKNKLYDKLKVEYDHKNIIWKGFILDRKELFKETASSEILVYPSEWEALPWPALLEGMASGRPVVASNLYGVDKIFKNNKEILLSEPKNENDIAEKIMDLIKNKKKANEIGKNGKKLIEREYDLDVVSRKVYNYY